MKTFWRWLNRFDMAIGHRIPWLCSLAWDHDERWLASFLREGERDLSKYVDWTP